MYLSISKSRFQIGRVHVFRFLKGWIKKKRREVYIASATHRIEHKMVEAASAHKYSRSVSLYVLLAIFSVASEAFWVKTIEEQLDLENMGVSQRHAGLNAFNAASDVGDDSSILTTVPSVAVSFVDHYLNPATLIDRRLLEDSLSSSATASDSVSVSVSPTLTLSGSASATVTPSTSPSFSPVPPTTVVLTASTNEEPRMQSRPFATNWPLG